MINRLPFILIVSLILVGSVYGQNKISSIDKIINSREAGQTVLSELVYTKLSPGKPHNNLLGNDDPEEAHFVMDTAVIFSLGNPPQRQIFDYSESGYNLEFLVQNYENNIWVNNLIETSTFDIDGNKLTSLWKVWNNGIWVNEQTETNTYANSKLLESVRQKWIMNQWVNSEKETFQYDSFGNMISYTSEYWLAVSWVYKDHELYTYDNLGNILTRFVEKWDNGGWQSMARYSYDYNQLGDRVFELAEEWVSGGWKNSSKGSYVYDAQSYLKTYQVEVWLNGWWQYDTRHSFTYDSSGRLVTETIENFINGSWNNSKRDNYSYNFFNEVQSLLIEEWDNGAWRNVSLSAYDYDASGNAESGRYYVWDGSTWNQTEDGNLTISYDFGSDYKIFTAIEVKAHYKSVNSGINFISDHGLTRFQCQPNPANDYFDVVLDLSESMFANLVVIDLQGKVIQTIFNGEFHKGVNVIEVKSAAMPAGVYLVTLNSNDRIAVTKLIIQ